MPGRFSSLVVTQFDDLWTGYRRALAGFGRIHFARTMAEALTTLETGKISMICCQVRMPDASIIDLLRFVKIQNLAIPLIVFGVNYDEGAELLLRRAGVDHVVHRTFDEILVKRVAEWAVLDRIVRAVEIERVVERMRDHFHRKTILFNDKVFSEKVELAHSHAVDEEEPED